MTGAGDAAPPRPSAAAATARPGCADPRPGRRIQKLGPGDHAVTDDPATLLLTVLGSCVAACVHDPVARVGGMNHFMLPESPDGRWGQGGAGSLRYGNFAMDRLIEDILRRGGRRERLEAKVFGGARIGTDTSAIGERNARFVEAWLREARLPVLAAVLGGTQARRLAYLPADGRAFASGLPVPEADLIEVERRLHRAPALSNPD